MPSNLKLPPQNLEAEQSVLGALMLDKNAIINVADILVVEDFYKPAHAKIYEVILALYEKRDPIDILSVTSKLKNENILKEIGGHSYLTQLMESVPTAAHVEHYAKIVREKRLLRELIKASAEITEHAVGATEDIEDILGNVEQKVFAISKRSFSQKFARLKDELQGAYARIEKLHNGEGALRGVPTGFQEIDDKLSGLQNSDLVVLGARPSLGKTSLALDIAKNAAKANVPVGIFSLEMSREQIVDRLIASEAQVPLWELRTGKLRNDEDFELIQQALSDLSQLPIFIEDTPSPSILQMRSMARRLQSEQGGLGLIVVDYLQLIQPRMQTDNLVQQVTEFSRGLKSMARELNVPVLALSQLSREVDKRDNKQPRLSDLRESGAIEQDADVVMFIYRKDHGQKNPLPEDQNMAEIIIAKHRNGPTGFVKLKFDPEKASFRSIDKHHS